LRTVTFGTIMERLAGDTSANAYVASKVQLGNFVAGFSAGQVSPLHIRIHTLYGGGPPDDFMFLGQMLHALVSGSGFSMSPGVQLREYHHIDDEIIAISRLVEAGNCGVMDLNHGAPVRLKELASHVFEQFDRRELLNIGALPGPAADNYETLFERTPLLKGLVFRDTLPAIVEYLRSCRSSPG
jgi:nucleoside-diphosphate-sugar epimerase